MHQTFTELTRSDALVPFLPLLYAAWLDGELEPSELTDLKGHLLSIEGLEPRQSSAVAEWLDPESPPSAEDLARLGSHIRRIARHPDIGERPSEIGLRLAGSVDEEVAAHLRDAERAAGDFTFRVGAHLLSDTRHPSITLGPIPDPGPTPPGFAALADALDGPYGRTKARVRQILTRPEFSPPVGLGMHEYRELVLSWTRTLADEGLGAIGFPAEFGGSDNPGEFLAAFAELGRHDGSLLTKFGVQFGLFAGAVFRLGTEQHHRSILPDAVTLELPGCFAMSETGHGSNVAELETTATYVAETDEFEIHTPNDLARKDYIGNAAAHGRVAVVFAQLCIEDLEHGVHAFLVPLRDERGRVLEGRRIEDNGPKAGLDGVDNGRIWFDRVRVPRSALLDRFASVDADGHYVSSIASPARRFFTTLGTLVGGRVGVASAAIGSAETGLAIALRYATRRRQFGTTPDGEIPLISYRSHHRRLIPPLALTIGYHFACSELVSRYVESERLEVGTDRRELEATAAGIKAFATWHASEALQASREACGGQGYLAENRIGGLRADADVFTTYEGDNTVLAQLVTKALLTEYRSSFEELDLLRAVEFIRSRVATIVTEVVPRVGMVTGDLDDPDTQRQLLERRERHVIETLAGRIRHRIDDGMDPAAAFLDVQPHALIAARAHIERVVFDAFEITRDRHPQASKIIGDLRTLASLSVVERDLGWFLQHGVVNPATAARIRSEVTSRSGELAASALHLVGALRIPDEVIAAPIAL